MFGEDFRKKSVPGFFQMQKNRKKCKENATEGDPEGLPTKKSPAVHIAHSGGNGSGHS